ncbi:Hypothetical predicted protein [Octopus vulgaris]|uniref:Uncharacterized protein n=1 Tax=Octopus vulgaris TaxID=6645 RepID=A0AA36F349_OCTVU|nr:Hypothetical predicted protein [Octopus vulgaris]
MLTINSLSLIRIVEINLGSQVGLNSEILYWRSTALEEYNFFYSRSTTSYNGGTQPLLEEYDILYKWAFPKVKTLSPCYKLLSTLKCTKVNKQKKKSNKN